MCQKLFVEFHDVDELKDNGDEAVGDHDVFKSDDDLDKLEAVDDVLGNADENALEDVNEESNDDDVETIGNDDDEV